MASARREGPVQGHSSMGDGREGNSREWKGKGPWATSLWYKEEQSCAGDRKWAEKRGPRPPGLAHAWAQDGDAAWAKSTRKTQICKVMAPRDGQCVCWRDGLGSPDDPRGEQLNLAGKPLQEGLLIIGFFAIFSGYTGYGFKYSPTPFFLFQFKDWLKLRQWLLGIGGKF